MFWRRRGLWRFLLVSGVYFLLKQIPLFTSSLNFSSTNPEKTPFLSFLLSVFCSFVFKSQKCFTHLSKKNCSSSINVVLITDHWVVLSIIFLIFLRNNRDILLKGKFDRFVNIWWDFFLCSCKNIFSWFSWNKTWTKCFCMQCSVGIRVSTRGRRGDAESLAVFLCSDFSFC